MQDHVEVPRYHAPLARWCAGTFRASAQCVGSRKAAVEGEIRDAARDVVAHVEPSVARLGPTDEDLVVWPPPRSGRRGGRCAEGIR